MTVCDDTYPNSSLDGWLSTEGFSALHLPVVKLPSTVLSMESHHMRHLLNSPASASTVRAQSTLQGHLHKHRRFCYAVHVSERRCWRTALMRRWSSF